MDVICWLISLYSFILFIRVILSWIPRLPEGIRPVATVIYMVTEPVIRFARPLVPPLRIGAVALDLSIILIFVLLQLLQYAIC